jgi:hypothetical protein
MARHAPWKKGESGNPRGRERGSRNRFTKAKELWLDCFDALGGLDALTEWARENPSDFYRLYIHLLPRDVNATISGPSLTDVLAAANIFRDDEQDDETEAVH